MTGQPAGTVRLSPIPPVTQVRFFAPPDVTPLTDTFVASIDLSGADPQADAVSVAVSVRSVDPRITVISFVPAFVSVRLETVKTKDVPVRVEIGPHASGLELGVTKVVPETVKVSGPESAIAEVASVRADVAIDPGGLDFDQDVPLIAVDLLGNAVRPIEVSPATARVTIPVFTDRESRSVPVAPIVTGTPAAGFEIASITADPAIVTVEGDADQLVELDHARHAAGLGGWGVVRRLGRRLVGPADRRRPARDRCHPGDGDPPTRHGDPLVQRRVSGSSGAARRDLHAIDRSSPA